MLREFWFSFSPFLLDFHTSSCAPKLCGVWGNSSYAENGFPTPKDALRSCSQTTQNLLSTLK